MSLACAVAAAMATTTLKLPSPLQVLVAKPVSISLILGLYTLALLGASNAHDELSTTWETPPVFETFSSYEDMQRYFDHRNQRRLRHIENPLKDSYIEAYNQHNEQEEQRNKRSTREQQELQPQPDLIKFEMSDAVEPSDEVKQLIRQYKSREFQQHEKYMETVPPSINKNAEAINKPIVKRNPTNDINKPNVFGKRLNRPRRSMPHQQPANFKVKYIPFEVTDAREPDAHTKSLIKRMRALEIERLDKQLSFQQTENRSVVKTDYLDTASTTTKKPFTKRSKFTKQWKPKRIRREAAAPEMIKFEIADAKDPDPSLKTFMNTKQNRETKDLKFESTPAAKPTRPTDSTNSDQNYQDTKTYFVYKEAPTKVKKSTAGIPHNVQNIISHLIKGGGGAGGGGGGGGKAYLKYLPAQKLDYNNLKAAYPIAKGGGVIYGHGGGGGVVGGGGGGGGYGKYVHAVPVKFVYHPVAVGAAGGHGSGYEGGGGGGGHEGGGGGGAVALPVKYVALEGGKGGYGGGEGGHGGGYSAAEEGHGGAFAAAGGHSGAHASGYAVAGEPHGGGYAAGGGGHSGGYAAGGGGHGDGYAASSGGHGSASLAGRGGHESGYGVEGEAGYEAGGIPVKYVAVIAPERGHDGGYGAIGGLEASHGGGYAVGRDAGYGGVKGEGGGGNIASSAKGAYVTGGGHGGAYAAGGVQGAGLGAHANYVSYGSKNAGGGIGGGHIGIDGGAYIAAHAPASIVHPIVVAEGGGGQQKRPAYDAGSGEVAAAKNAGNDAIKTIPAPQFKGETKYSVVPTVEQYAKTPTQDFHLKLYSPESLIAKAQLIAKDQAKAIAEEGQKAVSAAYSLAAAKAGEAFGVGKGDYAGGGAVKHIGGYVGPEGNFGFKADGDLAQGKGAAEAGAGYGGGGGGAGPVIKIEYHAPAESFKGNYKDVVEFQQLSALVGKSPEDQIHGLTYLLAKEMQNRLHLQRQHNFGGRGGGVGKGAASFDADKEGGGYGGGGEALNARPQDNKAPVLFLPQEAEALGDGGAAAGVKGTGGSGGGFYKPIVGKYIGMAKSKQYIPIIEQATAEELKGSGGAEGEGIGGKLASNNYGLSGNYKGLDSLKGVAGGLGAKAAGGGDEVFNANGYEEAAAKLQSYASKYAFGYRIRDFNTGNDFGHKQNRDLHGVTRGQYHILLPDGRIQNVIYHADDTGFHADVSFESGR